jgi:hypothetical protein
VICRYTLGELRDLNNAELKALVILNRYDGGDTPLDDNKRDEYTLALEGVEIRLKEIIKRGKLIDTVKPGQGPPLPL